MKADLLLSSDLDRTILPNGAQPESPQARPKLHKLASWPEIIVAYVSGRHESLIRQAIEEYQIPVPDYAIGDVGTSIYQIQGEKWRFLPEWQQAIAPDWNNASGQELADLFSDLPELRLQEQEKQNTFKLSYYTAAQLDQQTLIKEMDSRLAKHGVKASLIWSVDEAANVGLLDVLPQSATKLHAIQFLIEYLELDPGNAVFAGDSGNDLPVVCSGELQSILVKNAHTDVIETAINALREKQAVDKLYVAKGGFLQMNGNYSAGVLEGIAHYLPQTRAWMGK